MMVYFGSQDFFSLHTVWQSIKRPGSYQGNGIWVFLIYFDCSEAILLTANLFVTECSPEQLHRIAKLLFDRKKKGGTDVALYSNWKWNWGEIPFESGWVSCYHSGKGRRYQSMDMNKRGRQKQSKHNKSSMCSNRNLQAEKDENICVSQKKTEQHTGQDVESKEEKRSWFDDLFRLSLELPSKDPFEKEHVWSVCICDSLSVSRRWSTGWHNTPSDKDRVWAGEEGGRNGCK